MDVEPAQEVLCPYLDLRQIGAELVFIGALSAIS
jgi:hypothetical protein